MATESRARLTYEELKALPDDNRRHELIDGELVVTPAPSRRHQRVVGRLHVALIEYERAAGGETLQAPFDVTLSRNDVVQPDLLFVRHDHVGRLTETNLPAAPDVVVEVSSPSTRRLELGRKMELYERFGVPEYWVVDLDADRIEVYVLAGGRYGGPTLLGRGDRLESTVLPGFAVPVGEILGPSS